MKWNWIKWNWNESKVKIKRRWFAKKQLNLIKEMINWRLLETKVIVSEFKKREKWKEIIMVSCYWHCLSLKHKIENDVSNDKYSQDCKVVKYNPKINEEIVCT